MNLVLDADAAIRFALAALAVWRLTHLLAQEDGPFDAIVLLRRALGQNALGHLMDCFYCLSLWIAAPAAFVVCRTGPETVLVWLALSGTACLLNRIGGPTVSIPSGERSDELLWSKESRAGEPATGLHVTRLD